MPNICCDRLCRPKKKINKRSNIDEIINKDCIDYNLVNNLGEECCICINTMDINQTATLLKCGHVYHSHCIYSWFLKKQVCPLCETKIEKI